MTISENEEVGSKTLARLFDITQDILQAQEIGDALLSIARGLSDLFGFKCVSIVASDVPGGELSRRVLLGFSDEIVRNRLGEHVPRAGILKLLSPDFEVVPNCFYLPAESETAWDHTIFIDHLPRDAQRTDLGVWHEKDSLAMVLADRAGSMLGYISVDRPDDGRVPSHETLRQMQLFVNLVGLALTNARAHQSEIERGRLLEETSRAQNDFLSMVSHEVRSPLAAIRGATSLLESHFLALDERRREELLGVLGSSTARLSGIFEDFLLLSRMDVGKLTLRLQPVKPALVARESIARIQSEHPDRRFHMQDVQGVPDVYADEGRVVQILTNLLSNAAKYADEGSEVAVGLGPAEDRVRFTVQNQGPELLPHDRDKLFTRFGRGSNANDHSVGLGLYICAQLVEMMDGTIGCESGPGGTTFWFELPRAR